MERIYVGLGKNLTREVFKSEVVPTADSHGSLYDASIGPFKTMRGARFMALYGKGNPHCQNVNDAERLARQEQALVLLGFKP